MNRIVSKEINIQAMIYANNQVKRIVLKSIGDTKKVAKAKAKLLKRAWNSTPRPERKRP